MSRIDELIDYVVGLKYEDLPERVVEGVKKSVLDTLGATIAGSSAEGCEGLVRLAEGWGGREEATIFVYGSKVPAPIAALVNCTMARALDLDDVNESGGGHANATIVPSAFTICEYSKLFKDRTITGKDFILASALGSDLNCRLRMAGGEGTIGSGWIAETFAPIAVAAMGGKMLGFGKTKTLNAMGIAYSQCSGNVQPNLEGVLTVRLQQGLGAKAGILSIALADQGFTGPKDILEGKYGLYSLYSRGEYAPEVLMAELGKRFEGNNSSIKSYPCCRHTHAPIDRALELTKEQRLKADDIEQVIIRTNQYGYNLCGGEGKILPQNVVDAQFSFYYAVATALVKNKVFIEDFTQEAIRNPQVLAMARRVKVIVDAGKEKLHKLIPPVDIEIDTKDGKHYKKTVEFAKGHPQNPMSMSECAQKLKNCARFSAKPLPERNIDRIYQLVEHLDELDDVTVILENLG